MGREIKRVPVGFDAPIDEVWPGYLMPDRLHEVRCSSCAGDGYSAFAGHQKDRWYGDAPFDPAETGSTRLEPQTPVVRAIAERNVARSPEYYGRGELAIVREAIRLCAMWNGMWSHHLSQEDVDALIEGGRLRDLTHTFVDGAGWQPKTPTPTVTAAQVNTWSLTGFGHDSINCLVVVKAACERANQPATCPGCDGHGSTERYPGQRAEAEAWEPTEPPTGDGWQLWSTTSEGHPASPVFATGDELAQWMSTNPCGFAGTTCPLDVAMRWVHGPGWSLSMIGTSTGLQDGITAMGGA